MIAIKLTNELLNYKDFVKYSPIFIETGCAEADGVYRALAAGFNEITSIEASYYYWRRSFEKFERDSRVTIMHGKSVGVLASLLPTLRNGKPVVFYLDAHVSGETSAGYEDWIEKGEESDFAQDKTIKAELAIILAHSNKHVIIIDDVNGVADGHAHEYAAIMQEANPGYKFYFYDECLSGDVKYFYHEKLLVAIPN